MPWESRWTGCWKGQNIGEVPNEHEREMRSLFSSRLPCNLWFDMRVLVLVSHFVHSIRAIF